MEDWIQEYVSEFMEMAKKNGNRSQKKIAKALDVFEHNFLFHHPNLTKSHLTAARLGILRADKESRRKEEQDANGTDC